MPTFKVGDKVRVDWGIDSGCADPVWDGEVAYQPSSDSGMYLVTAAGCGYPTIDYGSVKVRYAKVTEMCWSPKVLQKGVTAAKDPYARAPDGMTGGPSGLKWL